jgi:hypothetical protein
MIKGYIKSAYIDLPKRHLLCVLFLSSTFIKYSKGQYKTLVNLIVKNI